MVLPLDMPDDYPWLPGSSRGVLVDIGELAARLGTPNVYDRRGETLFVYKPIHGLSPWSVLGGGTGYGIKVSTETALFDGVSIKMIGGSNGAQLARLEKYFDVVDVVSFGFEVSFSEYEEVSHIILLVDYNESGTTYLGQFKIDFVNRQLLYWGDDGAFHIIDDLKATFGGIYNFLYFKFVINIESKKYTRFIAGHNEYRVSDLLLQPRAGGAYEYYRLSFDMVSKAGINGYGFLGHAIITGNDL